MDSDDPLRLVRKVGWQRKRRPKSKLRFLSYPRRSSFPVAQLDPANDKCPLAGFS